jgi:DNA-binding XRE family transcriptional regulator
VPSLRELRLRKMWSQRDLAREAGVTQKTIVDLELGRVEPHLKTMRKLTAALGIEPLEVAEFQQAIADKGAAKLTLGGDAHPVSQAPDAPEDVSHGCALC